MRRSSNQARQGTGSSRRRFGRHVELLVVRENSTALTSIPRMWRVSHFARNLDVSRQWVYRWIAEGRIPAYRLFGAILLREEDIRALLAQHGIPLKRGRL